MNIRPPIAGPRIKPRLNVVKYFPIQAPRVSTGTESISSASAVGNTAPADAPSMMRKNRSDPKSRAKPNIIVERAYVNNATIKIVFLPILSEIPGIIPERTFLT